MSEKQTILQTVIPSEQSERRGSPGCPTRSALGMTGNYAPGLEGVVVAKTKLSMVDGLAGQLIICGIAVEDLAARSTFAGLAGLLWQADPSAIEQALGAARVWMAQRQEQWQHALMIRDPMAALRAAIAGMEEADNDQLTSARLTSAMPVFMAAWWRTRQSLPLLQPDAQAEHVADSLRLLTGGSDPKLVHALATYLMVVSDHGMNASTFTTRVIASTASDLVSAVVGGIGALKGPLHGGAPGPVLDMLDAIAEPSRARAWIESELAAGRRIMGMGHRIYRVRDPRAQAFEVVLDQLGNDSPRLRLAREVEQTANALFAERKPDRPIKANVEFYTAVLLEAVGIPRELFSTMFAAGRVLGWCGHYMEERATGRLIRPASEYIGEV